MLVFIIINFQYHQSQVSLDLLFMVKQLFIFAHPIIEEFIKQLVFLVT